MRLPKSTKKRRQSRTVKTLYGAWSFEPPVLLLGGNGGSRECQNIRSALSLEDKSHNYFAEIDDSSEDAKIKTYGRN